MKRLRMALVFLLCLALVAPSAFAGPTKVKVAFATWVGYGPLYIAKDKGFFEKQGLDVELMIIDDESQYAAAMASGNIDALGNVLDREVIHYAKGTPEVVLFAMPLPISKRWPISKGKTSDWTRVPHRTFSF